MLGQTGQASCASCALSNALKGLGYDVSEAEVQKWMDRVRRQQDPGATGSGSDLLARAASEGKYRLRVRKLVTNDRDYAVLALRGALASGAVALLHVDDDEEGGHWVSAIGVLGQRFLVADGADREIVLSYDEDALITRWTNETGTLYGIVLNRKSK